MRRMCAHATSGVRGGMRWRRDGDMQTDRIEEMMTDFIILIHIIMGSGSFAKNKLK